MHGGLKPDAKWERPLLASGHVSDWPKDVSGKVKGQPPEKSPSFEHTCGSHYHYSASGGMIRFPTGAEGLQYHHTQSVNIQAFTSGQIYQIEINPPIF